MCAVTYIEIQHIRSHYPALLGRRALSVTVAW